MNTIRSRAGDAVVSLVTMALVGCHALPPLRYYTLQAVPPASSSAPATAALLRIRHVGIPHEMDHLGLTHRRDATELAISDSDRWSAPLAELIQGTLTSDLGARLGFDHVVSADAIATHGGAPAALDVDFVELSADDTCNVSAQVNWTVSGSGTATRRGSVHVQAAAGSCPAGLPGALSTALGELADQLVPQLAQP